MKLPIITATKTEVAVTEAHPMEPQFVRVLDSRGMQVAFVCIGRNTTSVHIGICQEENFELELDSSR